MILKKITILILLILFSGSCDKNADDTYTIKFYGDARQDLGNSVVIASDGYIIAGQMELLQRELGAISDITNKNMAIIKTDWNGNIKWKVTTGGKLDDTGSKLYQLADGSVVCVGTSDTTAYNWKKEIFIVKVSTSGEILWKKKYGGDGNQIGRDLAEASDGFIVIGTTDAEDVSIGDGSGNPAGKTNIYILHLSSGGDSISSYSAGFPGNEEAAVIKKDLDGGYIVLGTTDRSLTGMAGNNLFLVRLNGQGRYIEQNIIGTTDDEYASGLVVLQDGYLVSGTIGTQGSGQQAYFVKIPHNIFNTALVSQKYVINSTPTCINTIIPFTGGNYLAGGYLSTTAGLRMLVFEIGEDGTQIPGKSFIKGGTGDQVINDLAAGDDGYIIAVGSNSYSVNSEILFLKFKLEK